MSSAYEWLIGTRHLRSTHRRGFVSFVALISVMGLTLGVATALDLFVVWFFKRPTVFLIARNETLVNMHGFGLRSGIAGDPDPDDAPAGGTP